LASTGSDFAGDIAAIGEKAQRFKVGDRVMGFGGVFGCGSHAQYVTFAEKKAITIIPDKLNDEDAAACLEGAIYAASAINFLKPKAGQNALVNGATGAIGSAYVQILKSFGVTVTGTCSGENKTIVQSLGADRVIDYLVEDFTKDTGVYDFIFDAVGKSNFAKCKRLLKHQGIFISSQPNPLNSVITKLFGHKKEIFSPGINIKAELDYIKSLVEKGQFKPVIDRTYPLDKIAEAFNYVATGQKTGNVIITMDI
jgi:NADPH:quinone reductase-like Zn-dependent oxidoreductase